VVLLLRSPVIVLAICAAAVGTVGVFTFAKPDYRAGYEREPISSREYHSPESVRRAFQAHGVDLRHRTNFSGVRGMSDDRTWQATDLQVHVAPREGRVDWGLKLQPYDVRFDNVLVTYGENDQELLRRVQAAVADLR
jgi:hypothetical protein